MRFIGLDLAWSFRNPTGAAAIEGDTMGGRLIAARLLHDDDEVIGFVEEQARDGPALVAIDAPLSVPNETGRRPAEVEITPVFARYHAGAHPVNRTRLARDGIVRGEVILERLLAQGFVHHTEVEAHVPVRQIVEVYTHPAIVSIFELNRIIRYKARPNRSHEERLAEFATYQARLRSLKDAEPALLNTDDLLAQDITRLIKARLKDYEDILDGLMCAYIAHYLWHWGMARARVFGNITQGYITTPVPPALWSLTAQPDEGFPGHQR
jgi:predicted RNase H-like nuclease